MEASIKNIGLLEQDWVIKTIKRKRMNLIIMDYISSLNGLQIYNNLILLLKIWFKN